VVFACPGRAGRDIARLGASLIRRLLLLVATPLIVVAAVGPVLDPLARRMLRAPRRLPDEPGMTGALDALGGEVVRLRSRDGVRLSGRWLQAEPSNAPTGAGQGRGSPDPWVQDPREAILLLHGYSGSVAPDLIELAPFLRRTAGVLGLDFRGHGGSDDGPTTFGLLEVEDVAGALAWLGERGIVRVALVGSSMGGVTAIAAVGVLGDGRLAAADADPDSPSTAVDAPRPRIVAVIGESVTPRLAIVVGRRLGLPFGTLIADRLFGRVARMVGDDPRSLEPRAMVPLLEDLPLLLIAGDADRTLPITEARRLAAAAPPGSRFLEIAGADHGAGHAVDPAAYESAVTTLLREAFLVGRT
jgi:pimeloyl-ACP methyl ester carboxylesterase